MDLDEAAREALDSVESLLGNAETAEKALSEIAERLRKVQEELAAEGSDLAEEARSFLDEVARERQELAEECDATAQSLTALAEKLLSTHADAVSAIGESRGEIAALGEEAAHVRSEMGQLVASAQANVNAVGVYIRASEIALAGSVIAAGQSMGTARADLAGARDLIEARLGLMESYVADFCGETVEAMAKGWEESFEGAVKAAVRAGMDMVESNAQLVLRQAVESCRTRDVELLEEVAGLGQRLGDILHGLTSAVQEREIEVAQASASGLEEARETAAGLLELSEALEGVKQLLARFSFVRL